MKRLIFLLTLYLLTCFSSCINHDRGYDRTIDPEHIYFDYQVFGEEEDSTLTILLQYRFGGPHGRTLWPEQTGKVELDSIPIPPDSSKMTGAFYELQLSQQEFTGNHSIVFTANNNKQYREEFFFQPVSLLTDLRDTLERKELVLTLKGLEAEDYVRILLTDTSRYSEGIDRYDTVRNGQIVITKEELESLVNGPVNLQLIREYERPVKGATEKGGTITLSYGLHREFILKE